MTPQPQHPQRCDKSCEHFDDSGRTNKIFGLAFCKKHSLVVEPIFQNQTKITGCASHTSAGAQQRIDAVYNIIERGKSALAECEKDGWSSQTIQAKRDVLEWVKQEYDELLQAGDQHE